MPHDPEKYLYDIRSSGETGRVRPRRTIGKM